MTSEFGSMFKLVIENKDVLGKLMHKMSFLFYCNMQKYKTSRNVKMEGDFSCCFRLFRTFQVADVQTANRE